MTKATAANSTDNPLERLVFFSDAVFAIAITLLVIEIHVPHPAEPTVAAHLAALIDLSSSFFAFALSFLVIARFWIGHHTAFALIDHFDARLFWPNILLLMAIAFMPFATAYYASNLTALVPSLFYNGALLVTAIASRSVIGMATAPGRVRPGTDARTIAALKMRGTAVILGAVTTVIGVLVWRPLGELIHVITPLSFAQILLMTIPLWLRILKRRADRREAHAKQGTR